ncbi:hypothetical protein ACLOJK_009094 [Asimina triloba]
MEILRPKNDDSLLGSSLKGKIRITTRCLWLDKGKLLDALYKAAHAALSSCPVNCPLAHMERIVSEVLRKIVRKYSSKRPEVITIALENTTGVLADELRSRLSGESYDSLRLHLMNRAGNRPSKQMLSSRRLEEVDSDDAYSSDGLIEEDTEVEKVTPELSSPSSSAPSGSADFQELSGELETARVQNGSILKEHQESTENGNKRDKKSLKAKPSASKLAKCNKWRLEEVKKLIVLRGEMDDRFQKVKGRMALWEEISATMMEHGINRTSGQCKSRWTSLVQQYEECKTGKKGKGWAYFDDMDKILAPGEVAAK